MTYPVCWCIPVLWWISWWITKGFRCFYRIRNHSWNSIKYQYKVFFLFFYLPHLLPLLVTFPFLLHAWKWVFCLTCDFYLYPSLVINSKACTVKFGADNFVNHYRKEVLDSVFISRLVDILKTSSPILQRKAASILEFVTIIDPSMDTINSVDIESGLDAIFQQKVLEGMRNNDTISIKANYPISVCWSSNLSWILI